MANVQIVTIATGGYKEYFANFIYSLNNFMPYEKKMLTVLSDGLAEYHWRVVPNGIENISVEKIFDLIYPCINLNKPIFINSVINKACDYVFMIDVDTIFKEVKSYDWAWFKDELDSNKILVTKHPYYLLKNDFDGVSKDWWINNLYTSNLTEKNPIRASYIPSNEYTYINSAFWGARREEMIRFNNKLIELTRQDLTRYPNGYHIPKYMDENYVNRLVYEFMEGKSNEFSFSVNQFSHLYNTDSYDSDTVFMYQKHMKDFKVNRR